MIVTYQNGSSVEGVALFQSEDTLRVAFQTQEDVVAFHKLRGVWVSEDCEPVTVEFGSRRTAPPAAVEDCICSAELAARLVELLYTDSSRAEARSGKTATSRSVA